MNSLSYIVIKIDVYGKLLFQKNSKYWDKKKNIVMVIIKVKQKDIKGIVEKQ